MKFIRRPAAAALLAASFFASLFASFTACAATASMAPEAGAGMAGMADLADVPPGGPGPDDCGPGPGFRGPGPGMPFGPFHGLTLTEAQQDKLFTIMHA